MEEGGIPRAGEVNPVTINYDCRGALSSESAVSGIRWVVKEKGGFIGFAFVA